MSGKRKLGLTVVDIFLYASVTLAFELAKDFNMVGAENLRKYDRYDWAILLVGAWAVAGLIIKAYFDKSFSTRQDQPENKPEIKET